MNESKQRREQLRLKAGHMAEQVKDKADDARQAFDDGVDRMKDGPMDDVRGIQRDYADVKSGVASKSKKRRFNRTVILWAFVGLVVLMVFGGLIARAFAADGAVVIVIESYAVSDDGAYTLQGVGFPADQLPDCEPGARYVDDMSGEVFDPTAAVTGQPIRCEAPEDMGDASASDG